MIQSHRRRRTQYFGWLSPLIATWFGAVCLGQTSSPAPHWEIGPTGTSVSFRGISAPSDAVIWLSGSKSTVLLSTDGGSSWVNRSPDFGELEFRSIAGFSDRRCVVASAGTPAVILSTVDGGVSWREVYRHDSPRAFLDGLQFWNEQHGLAFGDPIDDHFLILETSDGGNNWQPLPSSILPNVLPGEAAFAASNSSLLLGAGGAVWIGTGGATEPHSRVLFRTNHEANWQIARAPIPSHSSSGIFSIAANPPSTRLNANSPLLVAVGGDYRPDAASLQTCVVSRDGGETWSAAIQPPTAFRSAVIGVPVSNSPADTVLWITVGPTGSEYSTDASHWHEFSTQGFHALALGETIIYATGADGRFAKLKLAKDN